VVKIILIQMASLRGSKEILCDSLIDSLNLIKTLDDTEIRNGINGIISFLKRERDEFKKKKKIK